MAVEIKQAVILAGGLGTRMKPFTDTNPKPMYPVKGKPFLEYLIEQVRDFGIRDIVLLLGYLPEKIQEYFGDGAGWGVKIHYDVTPVEWETGSRLRHAVPLIEDRFLFLYCDNYCPIDYSRLLVMHENSGARLTFTAYANRDGYTKSNLKIAPDGQVLVYDKKRQTEGLQGVDIGYAIVEKAVLSLIPEENCNFEAMVYPQLVAEGKLTAMVTEHRYYSIGSWQRIELTKRFFSPRKFIFLDRDGTLNTRPPRACYVEKPEDFHWLEGAIEAVRLLKEAGYSILLVSNQPGIARGNLTEESLLAIHRKMQADLSNQGTSIDRIYYCPHNWDEGCFCRKPKPGMFFQAQKEWDLKLTDCYMLGDDERDMEAGQAAGCHTLLIDEKHSLLDRVKELLEGDKQA